MEEEEKIYYDFEKYGRITKVLDKGIKDGYYYFIITFGTYPCAYVGIPKEKNNKLYNKRIEELDRKIDVYGGITYTGKDFSYNPIPIKNIYFIGWDYAHLGDYITYLKNEKIEDNIILKKWTLKEIKKEVKRVIRQIKKYEKKTK